MNTLEELIDKGFKEQTAELMIRYRMNVMGMTFEEAINKPKVQQGRPRKVANQ